MAYGSLYGSQIKPTGDNTLEQAYKPVKQFFVDAYNNKPNNAGLPYNFRLRSAPDNYQSVLTTPQARDYDAATGRLKVHPQVDPTKLQQFFQGQSQEVVGSLGQAIPSTPPADSWSNMFAPNTFSNLSTVNPVTQEPVLPSQQLKNPTNPSNSGAPAITQQPPVEVQPTSATASSWDMFDQGMFTNLDKTAQPNIQQTQADPSWLQSATDKVGEFFGIKNGTQYLRNNNGSLMVDAQGNNIVDTSGRSWNDIGAGVKGAADIGMGLYGMFTGFDQNQHQLDTQRGQLNLMREKYAEDKRKNQAIVAQNRGA